MNLIDLDGIFDETLALYLERNAGKLTEKQLEEKIPKLYEQFGNTYLKRIGCTPVQYYAAMSDATLAKTLAEHVHTATAVPDFLCRELEKRDCTSVLLPFLAEEEELATYAVNLIGADVAAFPAYLDILADPDRSSDLKDSACEMLRENADAAKERAIALYTSGTERTYTPEVLSRCKDKDERIYEILMQEYAAHADNIPLFAGYFAAYGDTRALPLLLDLIDRTDINYIDFQELKYAVEALGGEYTKPRDFSDDPYYKEMQEASKVPTDLFDPIPKN